MDYLQDIFLKILDKTQVPQKKAAFNHFKAYNKSKPANHLSDLEGLAKDQTFEQIRYIDLSKEIVHEIPPYLFKCRNAKSLDLSSTFISSLKGISKFKQLEFLFLDDCEQLKSIPSEIGQLKNLMGISISHAPIGTLPKSFFTLKNIVYCNLNENELTNEILFYLEELEYLVELDLSSNEMYNVDDPVLSLKYLIKADLSNNHFEQLPLDFNNSPLLEQLDISNNPLETLPNSFSSLKNLRELDARNCLLKQLPDLSQLVSCTVIEIGHFEMENIPLEIFNIPNLQELEIYDTKIKELPEEIGNLTTLDRLSISDSTLESLPSTISHLQNLSELTLRDNHLQSLPDELSQLKNLTTFSISNWNEGKNTFPELPLCICDLESLTELGASEIELESLPTNIGNLSNLSVIDLSNNPLHGLPPNFANLRKLKSLNLYECPFKEMPEIQAMGINELFEHLNKLRGVGKYSFIWELPNSLQTAFQQYLNFFTDYLSKLKGHEIVLSVLKTEEGLKLETEAKEQLTIDQIGEYLNEYLRYVKEEIQFSTETPQDNPKLELLKIQMEGQISHFKNQIRQIEFENKYLRKTLDKVLESHVNFSNIYQTPQLSAPNLPPNRSYNEEAERIKQLIIKNEFENAFNNLSLLVKQKYPSRLNEVVVLFSRMNGIRLEARIGSISYEQKQTQMNKLTSNVLELLQSL